MLTECRRAGFVEGPKFSADDSLLLAEVGITVGSMISPKLSADDILRGQIQSLGASASA